jgi:hypothetical protein
MITEQEASAAEVEAARKFLAREGTCLIIGPHHDVGRSNDLAERQMEYLHHGDPLVPRRRRFGLYTRSLMKGGAYFFIPGLRGLKYLAALGEGH